MYGAQTEYNAYIDYVVPNASLLLAKFRELELPVIWTNWSRKVDDGMYGVGRAPARMTGPDRATIAPLGIAQWEGTRVTHGRPSIASTDRAGSAQKATRATCTRATAT